MKTHLSPTELQFYSENTGSIICFSSDVLHHFHVHRQEKARTSEVGGQMFAEFLGKQVRIIRATGPNSTDKRGWSWFNPDRRHERAEIKNLFDQGLHYVGDWHTHSEPRPKPSRLDLTSMDDCFKKSRHELKSFIMVIVGQAEFPGGLWVSLHRESGMEHPTFFDATKM